MRWRFGHGLFLFNFVVNAINDLWRLATSCVQPKENNNDTF